MSFAVVPAAGASRRMGSPKLVLPFGGTTIIGALVSTLRAAGVRRVVVVVRPDGAPTRDAALAAGAEVAVNERPERGMLSTVITGLEALGGAAAIAAAGEPLLVAPADLPALRAATVTRVLAALATGGAPLAFPTVRGRHGHPLAIAPALVAEIATLDAASGLRQLRDRHPALEVEVDDLGAVADVDTPDDYDALGQGSPRSRASST